jgi:exopolysaccharide biosynthesis polyprenyl glycosylphosphotransferase
MRMNQRHEQARRRVNVTKLEVASDLLIGAAVWWGVLAAGQPGWTPIAPLTAVAVAVTTVLLVASTEGYTSAFGARRVMAHRRVVRACLLSGVMVLIADRSAVHRFGVTTLLLATVSGALAVQAGRVVLDRYLARLGHRGHTGQRVMVVADGDAAVDVLHLVDDHAPAGWSVVAAVGDCEAAAAARGIVHVGASGHLGELAERVRATTVVTAPAVLQDERRYVQLQALRHCGIDVHVHVGLRGLDHRHVRVAQLGRDALLHLDHVRLPRCQRAFKRALDIVVAATALVLSSPLLAVAAVAVKLQDGGAVLFRQRRVGRDGATFLMPKLRTMRPDAEQRLAELEHLNERDGGPLFKIRDDPRVTRIGKLLRATSIDELPQLVCVLRGEMSLIGPRPALPDEVAKFDARLASRHDVRPGMTGLWQVEERDNGSFESYRRLDLFYVENWSLLLDLTILLHTVPVVIVRGWTALHRPHITPSVPRDAVHTLSRNAGIPGDTGHDLSEELVAS